MVTFSSRQHAKLNTYIQIRQIETQLTMHKCQRETGIFEWKALLTSSLGLDINEMDMSTETFIGRPSTWTTAPPTSSTRFAIAPLANLPLLSYKQNSKVANFKPNQFWITGSQLKLAKFQVKSTKIQYKSAKFQVKLASYK